MGNTLNKMKFIAFIAILFCLLIAIPVSFAVDNETAVSICDDAQNSILSSIPDEDVLNSNDYYYDASVENDNGNGSIDNPYKELKSDRIQSNSTIHLAEGQYNLDKSITTDNLTIFGQNAERTIITFSGTGFNVKNSLVLQNLTLVNLAISDSSNSIINATNVIFKDSMKSSISTSFSETEVYIDNSTFLNNHAYSGAAININKGSLEIINSLFINNHAEQYGGAIYIRESKFICRNLEIINSTSKMGGAITALSTTLNLTNLTARNNGAKYSGGAIYAIFGSLSLNNSTFINNSAEKDGGALFIDEVDNFIPFNNSFTNNTAGSIAGAVYSAIGRDLNHYPILNESLKNSFFNNAASFENDVYECEAININYNSQNYILIQSDSLYNLTLPSSYDLRQYSMVTPVKNQGSNGNCWAFASIASLESCILKATGLTFDLSEENMKDLMSQFSSYGWSMETNEGGYDRMGHAYLVSWLGPVNESDDNYILDEVLSPVLNSIFHVQNILFLKRTTFTDNDEIKRAIMSYGAVSTCIHWYQSSDGTDNYRNGKNIYWYRTDKGANHAVAIVGWDDNYSKNNFKTTPSGDGAWIIKNSWGTGSGDKGYYYVSYYDTSLAPLNNPYSTYVFLFNDSIKYDKNYQYDVGGRTDFFLNSSNTVWYKNKFIASDNEYLTAVSTYFEKDTIWELSIYVNNVLKHTQSGKSTSSYSTIELTDFIPLNLGDIFEVEFKITVDNEASVPISEDIIASGVPINKQLFYENISFISYDGENWVDLYGLTWQYSSHTYASQVACIKAFTILNPVNTTINLTVENLDSPCLIKAVVLNQYGNPVLHGNVTLNVEGNDYVVKIVDGVASLYHVFNNFGDNFISASFEKVGFNSSSSQKTITIYKGSVEINLNITVDVVDATINIQLSKPINETVYLVVNQSTHNVSITNGFGKLDLTHLYYGTYAVKAYVISDQYNCENVTDSFNINYLIISIIASDVDTYYNENFTYRVRLADINDTSIEGKTVRFIIGNEVKENKTDSNGLASVKFNLYPGNYVINIITPEEDKYYEAGAINNIKIRSTINLPSISTYTYNSNYFVNLIDSVGNSLIDYEVTLSIGSNIYGLKTNANGLLNYNLKLAPGSYNVILNNLATGEVKTQTIKVVKRITENSNVVMYYGAGKYYKVKVFDDNGKIAKGVKVTFTINGVKYTRTTDNNGFASIKINLKPKTYKIVAEYKGFMVSNNIVVKTTIITKDITVKKGKAIKFKAKLVNKNGKILKNKKITFKFKGKTYKIKTNSKGKATLKIAKKYKKGKYTIKTSYGGLKIKNKIKIK